MLPKQSPTSPGQNLRQLLRINHVQYLLKLQTINSKLSPNYDSSKNQNGAPMPTSKVLIFDNLSCEMENSLSSSRKTLEQLGGFFLPNHIEIAIKEYRMSNIKQMFFSLLLSCPQNAPVPFLKRPRKFILSPGKPQILFPTKAIKIK